VAPWHRFVVLGVVVAGCARAVIAAQSPPVSDQVLAFEAVSIRPNTSGVPQMIISAPPSGLVTGSNVTVLMLIRYAYGIPDFRVVGAPAWASSMHFDVTARGPAQASADTTRAMVRTLLADRFAARVQPGTREMEMDVLTRAGRGLGPQLRVSQRPCDAAAAEPPGGERCGVRPAFGRITGRDVSIGEVAGGIGFMSRRHVVDETGLTGRYDVTLTYTPDAVVLNPSVRVEFPSIDPDGPSLATALREQLGLRLQQRRGPVDVLVVEQVEMPAPD
jgi:uncharacterized protein (TIGR03435 family)